MILCAYSILEYNPAILFYWVILGMLLTLILTYRYTNLVKLDLMKKISISVYSLLYFLFLVFLIIILSIGQSA